MTKIKEGNFGIGYVSSDFVAEFGAPEVESEKFQFRSVDLPRSMKDSEILAEFKIEEITLNQLAYLLETGEGMLKNGYSNIFYIKGYPSKVLSVYWSSGYGAWDVLCWSRGEVWRVSRRVFSPETGSQILSHSDPSVVPQFLETLIREHKDWKARLADAVIKEYKI